jgi:hypothetical protein
VTQIAPGDVGNFRVAANRLVAIDVYLGACQHNFWGKESEQ